MHKNTFRRRNIRSRYLKTKMDLTKMDLDEEMPIVVTVNFDVDSYVKGYHEYKSIWTPKIGEKLQTKREPENLVDKYAVCVKKIIKLLDTFRLVEMENLLKLFFIF